MLKYSQLNLLYILARYRLPSMSNYRIAAIVEGRDKVITKCLENIYAELGTQEILKSSVKEVVADSVFDFDTVVKLLFNHPKRRNLDAVICLGFFESGRPVDLSRLQVMYQGLQQLFYQTGIPIVCDLAQGKGSMMLTIKSKYGGTIEYGYKEAKKALQFIHLKD